MYEDYYGFVQPPFSLTPDPRFLSRSESHDLALQQVWQAIRRKEGFIVLTGDIGTGKTTLCRTLLEQFDQTTFTALILNPFLSVEELLREVLLSFGIVSKDALKSGRLATATKHELVRTLHDFLLSLVPLHGSAVLIIDEAQHLSPDVLEEIRVLSNLETNDQKLLQVVMVGQLNLLDVLATAELRQLDQRISIRCSLKPLTAKKSRPTSPTGSGSRADRRRSPSRRRRFDLVHAISGGVPRVINLLCDRALMVGCEQQTSRITEDHVVGAAAQLGQIPKGQIKGERAVTAKRRRPRAHGLLVLAAAILAAVAGGGLSLGNPLDLHERRPAPAAHAAGARVARSSGGAARARGPAGRNADPTADRRSFSLLIGTYDNAREVSEWKPC